MRSRIGSQGSQMFLVRPFGRAAGGWVDRRRGSLAGGRVLSRHARRNTDRGKELKTLAEFECEDRFEVLSRRPIEGVLGVAPASVAIALLAVVAVKKFDGSRGSSPQWCRTDWFSNVPGCGRGAPNPRDSTCRTAPRAEMQACTGPPNTRPVFQIDLYWTGPQYAAIPQ